MDSGAFKSLYYKNIISQAARDFRLDDSPAVYAWYRYLKFGEKITSAEKFVEHIDSLIGASLSDIFSGKIGTLYSVQVQEKSSEIGLKKRNVLLKLAATPEGREYIEKVLSSATYLQLPL